MKRAIQVVAGLAISAVALWLTLRGKDLGAIWAEVRAADYRYLAPFVLILLAIRESGQATAHMGVLAALARQLMHDEFRDRVETEDDPAALCRFLGDTVGA